MYITLLTPKPLIIGKPFLKKNGEEIRAGYAITHFFIAPSANPGKTFDVWTAASTLMSNDEAILRTTNLSVDFEVFIFSYSSWGDGNLYYRSLLKYLAQTNQL